ncbi:MAG: hypothetical protein MZU97_01100 [Bacillus subtilis]|nr:hypothetical protein [Bacillus subtilis]
MDFVQALMDKQFIFNDWGDVRSFLLQQLDQLNEVASEMTTQGLALNPAMIDELYVLARRIQLLAINNPVVLIQQAIIFYTAYNDYLIPFVRIFELARIEEVYEEIASLIAPQLKRNSICVTPMPSARSTKRRNIGRFTPR